MTPPALTPGDYTTLQTTRFDSKEVSLRPITRDLLAMGDSVAPSFTPGIADVSTLSHGSQMSGSAHPGSRDRRGRNSVRAKGQ